MRPENDEKRYLRNAFVVTALLVSIPLVWGAVRGFPEGFYVFLVPPMAGFLVLAYALENSVRRHRERIESLERRLREREEIEAHGTPRTTMPPFDPGARRERR